MYSLEQYISLITSIAMTLAGITACRLYGRDNREERGPKKKMDDKGASTCLDHFSVEPDVESTNRSITMGTTPSRLSRVHFHVVVIIKALHSYINSII